MKIAKLVVRNILPRFQHDCQSCRFLGNVNGRDLWVCSKGSGNEFSSRYGSDEAEYGSLGDLTPAGTDYALAAAIVKRGLPPNEYRY